MRSPSSVRLVEVSPRDGLQAEARLVPAATKIALIERLADAGLRTVEATSFVSPRWVPQLADGAEVLRGLRRKAGVAYPVLVPNLRGLEDALAAGAREIAVFGAASETFSRRNINCSIAESLARFAPVVARARDAGVRVRGYLSCAVACPYEGPIAPRRAAAAAKALWELGCDELSLGDTVGKGNPETVRWLVEACAAVIPVDRLAGHYHDTYGMAVANVLASLELGVTTFDGSVAGLGGCPYAPGASGNVATEELVWLFEGMGIATGVDLAKLVAAGRFAAEAAGAPNRSRVAAALAAR
ncbi:MAG TPA: hydroxymethylglutaryl-CoA lyase [Anaeromyxobacteraceae bacterium]|nr:hydroxymethylglutaryl-CoA lyase [Anaeromyxobacteraceae bacterium]